MQKRQKPTSHVVLFNFQAIAVFFAIDQQLLKKFSKGVSLTTLALPAQPRIGKKRRIGASDGVIVELNHDTEHTINDRHH